MFKLLILAGVGYVFYRALKTWLLSGSDRSIDANERPGGEVDDVLVQDPVCKTYIAQRSSLYLRRHGQLIYFCSEQCRDRYLEDHPGDHR